MKRVAVLGSTGSIGTNTLDVIASHPDRLQLVGIAAHSRIDLLAEQVATFHPRLVGVVAEEKARQLQAQLNGRTRVLAGVEGLTALATDPEVDVVVVGTSGSDALQPLLSSIDAGKTIALASKELLVMAGELVMRRVRERGTTLIPVDSEHAALFQMLQGVPREQVARLVITGSGGPLWKRRDSWDAVTRAEVLAHPKWAMGPKITVDSATLMNKGLELIEAHWLFDMPLDRLHIVIHPQAAIHGMVELVDGSCLAQLSVCDMRLPIQYALSFPERWPTALPRLRWTELSGLEFYEPDLERFPCLRLAWEAARAGGTAPAVLSAANDVAVQAFLREELPFSQIPQVISRVLSEHAPRAHPTLEEILEADHWARQTAARQVQPAARVAVPG